MQPITQETLAWPFRDTEWQNKFLIGCILSLVAIIIPIIGMIAYLPLYGYGLIVMRTMMRGEAPKLPKWDRWDNLFVDGFKGALAAIVYMLPGMITMTVGYFLYSALIFLTTFSAAQMSASRMHSIDPIVGMIIPMLVFFPLLCIGMVLTYVGMAITPISVGQYARTGRISAGYRFREIFSIIRANFGGFLLAWVLYGGLSMALSMIAIILYYSIILCCLVPFVLAPISFYLVLLWPTLFGAVYKEGWAKVNNSSPALVA